MPALLSALVFLLFAGMVANPAPTPPGGEFIPGHGEGRRIDCIPADASSGTPSLYNIPKPTKDNVTFVNTPPCFEARDPEIVNAPDYNCQKNFWDGAVTPEVANYTVVADNVIITDIWPDAETTRLAKQILPQSGQPNHDPSFDNGDFRDQIYRATCNDWCMFKPPFRTPALPYGGTFFCDFIFFYQGQNVGGQTVGREYIDRGGERYPKDDSCDPDDDFKNCPIFNILIRENAPVPEVAGGAAPGAEVTPLRCGATTPTPVSYQPQQSKESRAKAPLWQNILSLIWHETATAQTAETFINLVGKHDANGEWIFWRQDTTRAAKILAPNPNGREKIPEPVPPGRLGIPFRDKEYDAFFNLTASLLRNKKVLYLVEVGLIEQADAAREQNREMDVPYLEFRRSPDIHPTGKTLQLGTFPVVTARGWWELFPKESKPAIYLYPEEPIALNVKLGTQGELTVSDPPYDPDEGWNVLAHPDGSLETLGVKTSGVSDGHRTLPDVESRYPYLYYEALLDRVHIEPTGFLVRGTDLRSYLKKTLPQFGLNDRETADFIEYWMSRLDESQPYYFIHYLSEKQIEELEPLQISLISPIAPITPDTKIRIRPYFKPLSTQEAKQLQFTPQNFPSPPKREGFELVEWGGILVK